METTLTDRLVAFLATHGITVAAVRGNTIWATVEFSNYATDGSREWQYDAAQTDAIPANWSAVRRWLGY